MLRRPIRNRTWHGEGWANAYIDLQDALAEPTCMEVWVAKGAYYTAPEPTGTQQANKYASFRLKAGVQVYGGFAGGEVALGQRNPAVNVTVLTGDIERNDCSTMDCMESQSPPRRDNLETRLAGRSERNPRGELWKRSNGQLAILGHRTKYDPRRVHHYSR